MKLRCLHDVNNVIFIVFISELNGTSTSTTIRVSWLLDLTSVSPTNISIESYVVQAAYAGPCPGVSWHIGTDISKVCTTLRIWAKWGHVHVSVCWYIICHVYYVYAMEKSKSNWSRLLATSTAAVEVYVAVAIQASLSAIMPPI